MTKRVLAHAPAPTQIPDARPWRQWAKDNHVGVNFAWQAIGAGKLKVRRIGKRMLVRFEDGDNFISGLPEGAGPKPAGFAKAAE